MFDIMQVSDEALKRVLPKVSIRMVSRLIAAYPRAVGRTLLDVLAKSASPYTMEFIREDMNAAKIPSLAQIREAEKEFLMLLRAENALPVVAGFKAAA